VRDELRYALQTCRLAVRLTVVVVAVVVVREDVKKLDCDVGSIKLRVKYGDVCKERCEAIVNSTNSKLDLSVGASVRPILAPSFPLLLPHSAAFRSLLPLSPTCPEVKPK